MCFQLHPVTSSRTVRQGEESTGKEKKRRKLDSIISGLSAKTTSAPAAATSGAGSVSVSVSQRDMAPSVSITPVPRASGQLPPPAHGPRDDLFPDITLSRSSRRSQEASALPAHDMHKPDSKVGVRGAAGSEGLAGGALVTGMLGGDSMTHLAICLLSDQFTWRVMILLAKYNVC